MDKKDTIENLVKTLRRSLKSCNIPERKNQIQIAIYEIEALCWNVQKIVKKEVKI